MNMNEPRPMESNSNEPMETLLIDYHLGQLSEEQASQVEEAIAGSAELATQSRNLRQLLGLLDRDETPEPPNDLVDSILNHVTEHVDATERTIPFEAAASALPAGTTHDLSAAPVLSLRELVAIAACITLFVGIFVPGYYKAQSVARRHMCQDNLRQIATGLYNYANDHNGHVTYAGYVPNGSWLPGPVRAPDVPRASNTRHLYRLMKNGYVQDPKVFVCPSVPEGRPMQARNYTEFDDFAERANNTYSFMFMNVENPPTLEELTSAPKERMVLIADGSPLTDNRMTHRINPYNYQAANSPAHDQGAGQNAVYATGQGGWFTEPTIGVDNDNIYRAGKLVRYSGIETPTCETDSFLIP
jgi:hypothetical protein